MTGESQPLPGGKLLRDEYREVLAKTPGLFAPPKIEISRRPPFLTPDIVEEKFQGWLLTDSELTDALRTPEVLLLGVLSLHDEWGRPYQINSIEDLLSKVDPEKRKWTKSLTKKTATCLESRMDQMNLDEVRKAESMSPLQRLVKSLLDIYPEFETGNQIFFQLLDLENGPRFHPDTSDYYQSCYNKAVAKERRQRLSIFLPPRDDDSWVDYIMETRDNNLLESLDAAAFTDPELISIAEMFSETEEEIGDSGYSLKQEFHKQIYPDKLWNKSIDPSLDFVDRYRFCLKLTKILSVKYTPSSFPSSIMGLIEIINKNQERLEEFINWVAAGGDEIIPDWLLTKKNGAIKSNDRPNGRSDTKEPKRLIESPIQAYPGRELYYLSDIKALPDPQTLDPGLLEKYIEDGMIIPLPLEDVDKLNIVLAKIFPDPKAEDYLGKHFANAVPLLSCYSWETITRRIKTTEKGKLPAWTRKLTGRRKKVGIYGIALSLADRQIVIMTPIQKKTLRD